jgi:hypothetical protein
MLMTFLRKAACFTLILLLVSLAQAACTDVAPDGSCCWNRFNLEPANLVQVAAPTIVDLNETTGNLLVRGPLPLVIRNGSGNNPATSPCMNHSEWRFAYEELDVIMQSRSSPAYFTDTQRVRLASALETFDLSDYELIVISLIDDGAVDIAYLTVEEREFGGNFSNCSEPLKAGTIRGQDGHLIWSPVGFCASGDCHDLLYTDGAYCGYANLIDQIQTLVNEEALSGKKRLIYYHCVLGTDRTGGVTIGYLLRTNPDMTYCQALTYAQYLGKTSPPPQWTPNQASRNLAHAYCLAINGSCSVSCTSELTCPEPEIQDSADDSSSPIVVLVQPGGPAGSMIDFIFDDYDEIDGSRSNADVTIHHIHVVPSAAVTDPVLRVLPVSGIGQEKRLSGRAFTKYYEIDLLRVPDGSIAKAFIQFSLQEGYLASLHIQPEDVVMLRWDGTQWTELPTTLDHITRGRIFYTTETSGFSYFAVTNRLPAPVTPAIDEAGDDPVETASGICIPCSAVSGTYPADAAPTQVLAAQPTETPDSTPSPAAENPPSSGLPVSAFAATAGIATAGGYLVRRWRIRR